MISKIPFFINTFFWIFWTSLFTGAALSRITTLTGKIEDPEKQEKVKTRKWTMVCIWLSLGVLMFLCAIFIPGAAKIKDIRLLYMAGIMVPLFFLMFRFKKAIGLPVFLMALSMGILIALFLQSITAFTGEVEIGLFRVFSANEKRIKLEVERPGEAPLLLEMEGEYLAPVVKVIIFEDWLVFLGGKSWYRFIGLTSMGINEGEEIPVQKDRYHFERPSGISEELYTYFETNETEIPGVKSVQISIELKKLGTLEPLKSITLYSVRLQNDGTIQVLPVE